MSSIVDSKDLPTKENKLHDHKLPNFSIYTDIDLMLKYINGVKEYINISNIINVKWKTVAK